MLKCFLYENILRRIAAFIGSDDVTYPLKVLTGGEIPAMAISDSVIRLLDGVIIKESHVFDSFNDNLLDYPVYTQPSDFRGKKVPEVLLSGHHANIAKWRLAQSIKKTQERRPDLLEKR